MGHSVQPGLAVCGFAEQLSPWFHAPSDKNPNDVYVGSVILPGEELRAHAYVKVFPAEDRGQLVYNEVMGHYLAMQCGLPSPVTFPCACQTSLLRGASAATIAAESSSAFVLGVASIDGSYKEMKQKSSATAAKWADIMNWPHVARVAVFDELMGNDDRHLENLIRRGLHDYALIDNERILFGERWFDLDLITLQTRRCDANILADTIAEGTDEMMRQRMVHYAQHFVMATLLSVPEMSESLEQLCGARAGTTDRLVEMLNCRRHILPSLMQWHMQKGDLFQARTNR